MELVQQPAPSHMDTIHKLLPVFNVRYHNWSVELDTNLKSTGLFFSFLFFIWLYIPLDWNPMFNSLDPRSTNQFHRESGTYRFHRRRIPVNSLCPNEDLTWIKHIKIQEASSKIARGMNANLKKEEYPFQLPCEEEHSLFHSY